MKIMVTTYPFGQTDPSALTILSDHEVVTNDLKRKFSHDEIVERLHINNPDIIIAGTENYDASMLDSVPNLKMLARVGTGYDSVPLDECRKRGITVGYTPDAPSDAVADLTIGQIINALRGSQNVDRDMRNDGWTRNIGRELGECMVGVVGCGRIGGRVVDRLRGFGCQILVEDKNVYLEERYGIPSSKGEIIACADVISLHIPYSEENRHYIGASEFNRMKENACLVNMSRGGVVNEDALHQWLCLHPEATAVVDVFEQEPYLGPLRELDNAYLTPHLGSCTKTSRINMEVGISEEVLRFISGSKMKNRLV